MTYENVDNLTDDWKHKNLDLKEKIEEFKKTRNFKRCSISVLLGIYLDKCSELLSAELMGDFEEIYDHELQQIQKLFGEFSIELKDLEVLDIPSWQDQFQKQGKLNGCRN